MSRTSFIKHKKFIPISELVFLLDMFLLSRHEIDQKTEMMAKIYISRIQ